MKRVRVHGASLSFAGDDADETYRHLPTDFDLVDPVLVAVARHVTRASICVDVGAGFGLHTLALSVLAPAGRVIAVEPSPGAFAHLERNVAQNGAGNVTTRLMWPAGARTGAPFLDAAVARDGSTRDPTSVTEAACSTVDEVVHALGILRVDLLRVSLQGAELRVLDGARRTLQEWQPKTLVTFSSFDLAVRGGTLPHVALAQLRDMFPYCHVLDRADGSLSALATDAEADWFLYDNMSHGPVDDLLCTFDPLGAPAYTRRQVLGSVGELTTVVSQRDQARAAAAAAAAHNERLRRQNDELACVNDRLMAEIDAVHRTVSWRVTTPLRQVRARAVRTRTTTMPAEPRASGDAAHPPPMAVMGDADAGVAVRDGALPMPSQPMRQLVGPTDDASFDNPTGALVFPELGPEAYEAVFDFGCGCGRIARKLIQQRPRPARYVGVDLHRGMIDWCRANLMSAAPGFEFVHHDVSNPSLNPGPSSPQVAPFPVEDDAFSLLLAWSVFTHLTEAQAPHYLSEVSRVLRSGGTALTTWFLFEKSGFPMMQAFQNALYINVDDPTNAVIFDREWVRAKASAAGLTIVRADPPALRGYQWRLWLAPTEDGVDGVDLPADDALPGSLPPPLMPERPHTIGTPGSDTE